MLERPWTQRAGLPLCWNQSLESPAQPCRDAQFKSAGRTSEACLERFWRRASSRRSRRSISRLPAWRHIGAIVLRKVPKNFSEAQTSRASVCSASRHSTTLQLIRGISSSQTFCQP